MLHKEIVRELKRHKVPVNKMLRDLGISVYLFNKLKKKTKEQIMIEKIVKYIEKLPKNDGPGKGDS